MTADIFRVVLNPIVDHIDVKEAVTGKTIYQPNRSLHAPQPRKAMKDVTLRATAGVIPPCHARNIQGHQREGEKPSQCISLKRNVFIFVKIPYVQQNLTAHLSPDVLESVLTLSPAEHLSALSPNL